MSQQGTTLSCRVLSFAVALLPALCFANSQSVNLDGASGTYSIPNNRPFSNTTSTWVDFRIHDYQIPTGTCRNFASVAGFYQNGGITFRICDPSNAGAGGVFEVFGNYSTPGGVPSIVSPPNIQVLGIVPGYPTVLQLGASPMAAVMAVGKRITVWGVAGSGCSGLQGTQRITAVSSIALKVDYDSTGCVYTAGSARAYSQDVLYRFSENLATNQVVSEVWNVDGSGYNARVQPMTSYAALTFPQNDVPIGPVAASLGYLRWCSGPIATGSHAPWGGTAQACGSGAVLADWEFDGNGADSSGNGLNIQFSPAAAYSTTPLYPPACSPGAQQSFHAGATAKLDGSGSFPLDGGDALTYFWQPGTYLQPGTAPQDLVWSSHIVPNPTISGLLPGPINLNLTVTDGSGQSTTCELHDGIVATNESGNVIVPNAAIASILGPLTQWGDPNNRWPWLDTIAKTWADRLGTFQGKVIPGGITTDFVDAWNQAQAGTVGAVNNSNVITGTGTSFQTVFCGGPGMTSPSSNTYFIGWYNSGIGRRVYTVVGCPDQGTLTLNANWSPPTESGMQYAMWTDPGFGSWVNGSANINYYDNVAAFYAMYYRTGIDTYLGYARWLADRWWTMPWIDQGNANDCASNASLCNNGSLFPRIEAYTGMFLRAIDQDQVAGVPGSSPMWPGIRQWVDGPRRYTMNITASANLVIGDLREIAYNDLLVALCAAYDPDADHAAACRADVNNSILTTWQRQRYPDGHWAAVAGDFGAGTVTVTPGSNLVTLSGSTWDPAWFPAEFVSTGPDGTVVANRDSTYYNATYLDSSHIQLDTNYVDDCTSEGNSCSGRLWILASGPANTQWVGFGTQPFMLGVVGHWFNQAYIALSQDPQYAPTATLAKSYVVDLAKWITTSGTYTPARGLWYGVGFGVCTTSPIASCYSNGDPNDHEGARELTLEVLGELALAYSYAPDSALGPAIDDLFSAVYAKNPKDPGYDGTYAAGLDGFFLGTNNPKWFGFGWGMGRDPAWLAARSGLQLPSDHPRYPQAKDTRHQKASLRK